MHRRVRQHVLHVRDRTDLPHRTLPHEVWALLLLRGVGGGHDRLRSAVPAGDEEHSHRRDEPAVEGALVLE